MKAPLWHDLDLPKHHGSLISASSVPCDRENGSVWYAFLPYLYFSVQMFTRLVSTGNAECALTLDIHSNMDVTRTLHLSKKNKEGSGEVSGTGAAPYMALNSSIYGTKFSISRQTTVDIICTHMY